MSELAPELVNRKGCTPREAELLRAALLFGDGQLPLSVIGPEARANLEPHVEAMSTLDDDGRAALAQEWEVSDDITSVVERIDIEAHAMTLTPRWRRALKDAVERERVGVAFGDERVARLVRSLAFEGAPMRTVRQPDAHSPLMPLGSMTGDELELWLIRYGAALLASLASDIGRRKLARVARSLAPDERDLMSQVLASGLEMSDELRARVRELFIALSEGEPSTTEQIRQMGLYFVALAAGQRWATEVGFIASRLSDPSAAMLRRFHDTIRRSTRAHLEVEVRNLLQTLAQT